MKNEDRWKYYSDLIIKALNSVFDTNYPKNTPKIQTREMLS